MSIKSLWREPLVHFLFIGAALFLLYNVTRDGESEAPNRIVVTSGQQEQLIANFRRTWMRPPTEDEVAAMVENHVREEVLYREALAMGLDQNDPMVRRRMRMKLEFILDDLSTQNVTDEALTNFLQEYSDKFRIEAQVSFRHIYLNPDKRQDLATDAKILLGQLNDGIAPETLGDPTLLPTDYSLATQSEIARSFGERFAQDAIKLKPGNWTGPIYSAYGGHLLKVSEQLEARQPKLEDIREQVEREYQAQRRNEQKDVAYRKLRDGYDVMVEPLPSVEAAIGTVVTTAQGNAPSN